MGAMDLFKAPFNIAAYYLTFKLWVVLFQRKMLINFLLDISCLTRDRFVHHTLKYKRVFNGDVSK